jgi:hypothetical protein
VIVAAVDVVDEAVPIVGAPGTDALGPPEVAPMTPAKNPLIMLAPHH